eukprot:604682-Amorphochlora_amoeboformis.AAC.1
MTFKPDTADSVEGMFQRPLAEFSRKKVKEKRRRGGKSLPGRPGGRRAVPILEEYIVRMMRFRESETGLRSARKVAEGLQRGDFYSDFAPHIYENFKVGLVEFSCWEDQRGC